MTRILPLATLFAILLNSQLVLANYSVTNSEIHGLDVDNGRVILEKKDPSRNYFMCDYKGMPYYCTEESGGKPVQNNSRQAAPNPGNWDPNHDFSKDRY